MVGVAAQCWTKPRSALKPLAKLLAPVSGADESDVFMDTRLRLYFDFRPNPYVLVNYKMEIGDITFGAANPPI